jgi:hypothetical protein
MINLTLKNCNRLTLINIGETTTITSTFDNQNTIIKINFEALLVTELYEKIKNTLLVTSRLRDFIELTCFDSKRPILFNIAKLTTIKPTLDARQAIVKTKSDTITVIETYGQIEDKLKTNFHLLQSNEDIAEPWRQAQKQAEPTPEMETLNMVIEDQKKRHAHQAEC